MLFDLLDQLAPAGRAVSLRDGEHLFRRGDPADHMFAVRSGLVRLRCCTVDGRDVLMGRARAGETFAEAALTSEH